MIDRRHALPVSRQTRLVGIARAITLEAVHAVEALEEAFARYGLPVIVNTDQQAVWRQTYVKRCGGILIYLRNYLSILNSMVSMCLVDLENNVL